MRKTHATYRSLLYAKAVTVHPPPTGPGSEDAPFLVVHMTLDCSTCGESTLLVAGHHLRGVVRALQRVIDTVPEALTMEAETEIVERRFDRTFRPENN